MFTLGGKILIVGFGPGSFEHVTARAKEAILESRVIIGYNTYVDLLRGLLTDQEIVRTGMTEEVSRAQKAVDLAQQGRTVAVISSGDAGVYGMAGLVYEVLIERGWRSGDNPRVEVVPGVSAINSCAALLGAPIMHDACTISLSDHLTPWDVIAKRLDAAGEADFVIALYNPKSGRRTRQIEEAQRILLRHRSADTPVGLVKSAYRDRQQVTRTTLGDMLQHDIGMLTTVIVGNTMSFYHDDLLITPRGYQRKYTLNAERQALLPGQRLRPENEPWALRQADAGADAAARAANAGGAAAGASADIAADTLVDRAAGAFVDTAVMGPREWAAAALARVAVHGGGDMGTAAARTGAGAGSGKSAAAATVASLGEAPGLGSAPDGRLARPAPAAAIFEAAVSPGVANKKLTAPQLLLLAEIAGGDGEIEYTTAHQLILRARTDDSGNVVRRLREAGMTVLPVGDVVKLKACDFCDGDKHEGIPYAEEISARLAGLGVEKELRIGYNGCAMACYGAVNEDIGLVFRKGAFDLFLGGKTTGRNAAPGQRVAQGIPAQQMPDLLERIVAQYREHAFPGERFHKFFARMGNVVDFIHQDQPRAVEADTVCGT